MCAEVRSKEAGNVVVSPLSAAMVLALTWIGANGRTAQQLGDVLHLPLSRERVATGFRMLMGSLPTASNRVRISDDDPLVQLANRLYIPNGYQLEDAFSQTAVEDFKSDIEKLDFADADVARNTINQWVANNTDDLIENLIPE
ncbi:Alaserpin, partial [Gryllus bimaculatus]